MFKRLVVLLIVMVCLVSFSYAKKPVKLMDKDMSEIQGAFLPVVLPIMPTAPAMEPLNAASSLLEKNKRTIEYAGLGAGMLAVGLAAPEVGLPLDFSLYADSVMCRRQTQKTFDECMDERILDTLGEEVIGEGIEKKVSKTMGKALTVVGVADDACELLTDKKCGDALAYSGGVKVYIKSLDKTCTLVDKDKVACPTNTPCLTSNPPTDNGCDTITQQTFVKDQLGIWRQPGVNVLNDNSTQFLPFTPVFPTEKCEFEIPGGTKTSCYPNLLQDTHRRHNDHDSCPAEDSGGSRSPGAASGGSSLIGRLTGLQDASGQGMCVAPGKVTCVPDLLNPPTTYNPFNPTSNQICVINNATSGHSSGGSSGGGSSGGGSSGGSSGGSGSTGSTASRTTGSTSTTTTTSRTTSGYGSSPSTTVQKAASTVVSPTQSLRDFSPEEARAISLR